MTKSHSKPGATTKKRPTVKKPTHGQWLFNWIEYKGVENQSPNIQKKKPTRVKKSKKRNSAVNFCLLETNVSSYKPGLNLKESNISNSLESMGSQERNVTLYKPASFFPEAQEIPLSPILSNDGESEAQSYSTKNYEIQKRKKLNSQLGIKESNYTTVKSGPPDLRPPQLTNYQERLRLPGFYSLLCSIGRGNEYSIGR